MSMISLRNMVDKRLVYPKRKDSCHLIKSKKIIKLNMEMKIKMVTTEIICKYLV